MTELYAREIVGTVLNPVTFSHLQRPRWKYIQSAETHNVFETGTVVRRDHLGIELPVEATANEATIVHFNRTSL